MQSKPAFLVGTDSLIYVNDIHLEKDLKLFRNSNIS